MEQQTTKDLRGKPLFSLTVDEFISLQKTLGKENSLDSKFPEIMNIDLAASFTGYRKSTLYRKTCKNEIPFYRQGSRVLFKRTDLETWLLSDKQETVKEHIERLESEISKKKK